MKKENTMSEYIQSARIAIFLLIILVLVTPTLAALERDKKPNIVLVLMDNFGYGEIGVYGGGVLRGAATPNIDGIAAIVFCWHDSNTPVGWGNIMNFFFAPKSSGFPGGCH